jgi:hypothetical protein
MAVGEADAVARLAIGAAEAPVVPLALGCSWASQPTVIEATRTQATSRVTVIRREITSKGMSPRVRARTTRTLGRHRLRPIPHEDRVSRNDDGAQTDCLGNQHTVKRVAMDRLEPAGALSVGGREGA